MGMMRQLELSLFDFRLHHESQAPSADEVQALLDDVRDKTSVTPRVDFNRFQNGFGHIFAGGYAAGYYSYKWAEVLSADAYSAFEEAGIFDTATGQRFRQEILEWGGRATPPPCSKPFGTCTEHRTATAPFGIESTEAA